MIQHIADSIVYGLLGIDAASRIGAAMDFFIYDTVKILILLFLISILMGIVNAYFPVERLRNYLATRRLHGLQYLAASLFGAVTPFCSCSSIPLFIGFVRGGIPLGVTFSFLITSPLVNEVAVAKGIPLGTAIAFMMAVVGLSLPEATLLRKVMTWKLTGIFFGTVTFFITLSGYVYNLVM